MRSHEDHTGPVPVPVAESILRLQRDMGNRAVVEALQRETKPRAPLAASKVPPVPNVPVIGPTPIAVNALPKADANSNAQPLGETVVKSSKAPSLGIERVGTTTRGGTYTSKVNPAGPIEIQLEATYPAPGTYTLDKSLLLIEPEVAGHIRAGEQEHSNDRYLAVHSVHGAVAGAINRLAAQPPHTAKDLPAAWAHWRSALDAELPEGLRGGQVSKVVGRLHALSTERDDKGWHNMIFRAPLQHQVRATTIPKGFELKRVYPSGSIGKEGSQSRIDAVAPWLSRGRR